MLFRQIAYRLALALPLVIGAMGQPHAKEDFVMQGLVTASCGKFLTDSSEVKDNKQWIRTWNVAFSSFLSGLNLGTASAQMDDNRPVTAKALPDYDSFYWEIKKRCTASPQLTIVGTLIDLWKQLPEAQR